MKNWEEFKIESSELSICGTHIENDSIHVGICWNYENDKKIFHFLNGEIIPIESFYENKFKNYFFNPIDNFYSDDIPSLVGLSRLISKNKINRFIFNKEGIIYDGGIFEFVSGNYNKTNKSSKIINCAAFVIALLNTLNYTLIDWESWPNSNLQQSDYLNIWLEENKIPKDEWEYFYNQSKKIRGKHVLVAPQANSKPAQFEETDRMANEFIFSLQNP